MTIKTLDPLSLEFRGTKLIEASAGTGKTYTITTLLVRLLLEQDLEISQILVVTFTRAATAELRDRVRLRLREMHSALLGEAEILDPTLTALVAKRQQLGQVEADLRRLQAALHGLDDAAILTIHSFCQRVLRENAFESGQAFDAELVTELGPWIHTCVHDFWAQHLYALPVSLVKHIQATQNTRQGVSLQKLQRLAKTVLSHPDMPVLPETCAAPSTSQGEGELSRSEIDAALLHIQRSLVDFVRAELPPRLREAGVLSYEDLLVNLRDALRRDQNGNLATRIGERYRAALVDEFQDTDPIQYEIFQRVFHQRQAPLFLIGDPKQAIYSFRGADIFAYLAAVQDAGDGRSTLQTNYRSDPPLIGALNTLFSRVKLPFLFEQIDYIPVQSPGAGKRPEAKLRGRLCLPEKSHGHAGRDLSGLEILFLPRDSYVTKRTPFIGKSKVEQDLPRMIAAQIAALLNSGAEIDGVAVQPGDIAVLCQKNREIAPVQSALRALGIPSVMQTEASVFDSPEAQDMERLALAMAEPEQAQAVKAALIGPSLGRQLGSLRALQDDVSAWNSQISRFRDWHLIWKQNGFIQAFRRMMADEGVALRLLGYADGERSLTNLLHLAELMQSAASDAHLNPQGLCTWLQHMRQDRALRSELSETAQIRLESDTLAVKLVTIHRSKGLEYPIVYCPYLWDGSLLIGDSKSWPSFHDPDDQLRLKLDIGSESHAAHKSQAELEAQAERLRLLYVALTRAKHRCSIVWGGFNQAGNSPLAYLLHQVDEIPAGSTKAKAKRSAKAKVESTAEPPNPVDDLEKSPLGPQLAKATANKFKQIKEDEPLLDELRALVDTGAGQIQLTLLDPAAQVQPYLCPASKAPKLKARSMPQRPLSGWGLSSFSSLTKELPAHNPMAEGLDHDLSWPEEPLLGPLLEPPNEPAATPPVLLSGAPRGVVFGLQVHKIFELLDFTSEPEALRALVQKLSGRAPQASATPAVLSQAIQQVLETPLKQVAPDFCLRQLRRADRLDEMAFFLQAAQPPAKPLTSEALAKVFALHAQPQALRDYSAQLATLPFAPVAGFLTGFIDLIFVHQGRWFVVDYKTNHLGDQAGDYGAAPLAASMASHHYYLQYHIYVLALHRYLRQRLVSYDYQKDFGGVLYLFVRGMSPGAPADSGVYFDRPSAQLIDQLDALLAPPSSGSSAAATQSATPEGQHA